MGILDELMEDIKKSSIDEQVQRLCDEINAEEEIKEPKQLLELPNLFLAMPIPGLLPKSTDYLCLEREFVGKFIVSIWDKNIIHETFRRRQVFEIPPMDSPNAKKILAYYAKHLKIRRGEV